jgi:methionyl-tRNA synthetase
MTAAAVAAEDGRFYVTAAIDYVNGNPHLGHAYEKLGCDALARYHRLRGEEVRFTVGSDEHSQSVERAARAEGLDPATYCDRQVAIFKDLFERLDVTYTNFVRTSGDRNRRTTEQLLTIVHERGHIYKGMYAAWFCPSCEQFYTEKELIDGKCPVHHKAVEWVEEENWFFRLSAFQEPLRRLFEEQPEFLTPGSRRNEMLNVINDGLEDISISRGFTTWGFPLPFDPEQVAYVWFDALPAYITGVGYAADDTEFATYWPADLHVIGKDITRFHTIMWPAMLMAAGIALPRRVHSHGFITLGGRKMSKSSGVRIDPFDLVDRFGSDAVRYVFLSEVPYDRDGDFSVDSFVDRYNADLANDYGNLVSRTEKMTERYRAAVIPAPGPLEGVDRELEATALHSVQEHASAMADVNLSGAIAAAQRLVARANLYIDETKPWNMAREQDPRLDTVLHHLLEAVRIATTLLHPFVPRATRRVADDLGVSLDGAAAAAAGRFDVLTPGAPVIVGEILFPRLDRERVLADWTEPAGV